MMGKSLSHSDTLSGLLRLVKDPASVEAEVKKLQDAENAYKETVDKATKDLATQRASIASTASAQDAREAALSKRESEIAARETKYAAEAAALDKKRSEFEAFEKATSTKLAEQEQALKASQDAHERDKGTWLNTNAALAAAVTAREKRVAAMEEDLQKRNEILGRAVEAHAQKAAALKAALAQ